MRFKSCGCRSRLLALFYGTTRPALALSNQFEEDLRPTNDFWVVLDSGSAGWAACVSRRSDRLPTSASSKSMFTRSVRAVYARIGKNVEGAILAARSWYVAESANARGVVFYKLAN